MGKGQERASMRNGKRKGREKCFNSILIEYTYTYNICTQYTHILKLGMVAFTCNSSAKESEIKDP